jgi:hypothetical protein
MPAGSDVEAIPSCLSDITPEWLTVALRHWGHMGKGVVRSLELLPSAVGHGTISVAARVKLVHDGGGAHLPESMFVKLAPQGESSSRFEIGAREVVFYGEIGPRANVRIPACYYSAVDRERKRYVILLEDLSGTECGDWATGCSLERAALAVTRIARFHAQWWEHPCVADKSWLRTWDFAHWQRSYVQGLDSFVAEVQGQLPKDTIDASVRLADRFVELMEELHYGRPITIVHGDYQLDNLFFGMPGTDDDFIVADWQMVGLGRGAIDIGNFLGGNIDPLIRSAEETELLKTYHSILVDAGVDYSLEQCMRDYRLSMVERLARAVMRISGRFPGTTQQVRNRLEGAIFPRYFQAFADLRAWELV